MGTALGHAHAIMFAFPYYVYATTQIGYIFYIISFIQV